MCDRERKLGASINLYVLDYVCKMCIINYLRSQYQVKRNI